MVTAAHRYCLGRQTYIVGACVAWLQRWWPHFTNHTRCIIVRDTIAALQEGDAGADCDAKDWKRFAEWAWGRLDHDSQWYIRDAVAWRNKPWPLEDQP
jgi:hypothetical protein